MSAFLSKLNVSFMTDAKGLPLLNPDGKQLWQGEQVFRYQSDVAKKIIEVPVGFITDFDSTPRIPVAYVFLANQYPRSAYVHDHLYQTGELPRDIADNVLLEAMALDGVSWVKRKLVYAGVRVGGASHFAQTYRP